MKRGVWNTAMGVVGRDYMVPIRVPAHDLEGLSKHDQIEYIGAVVDQAVKRLKLVIAQDLHTSYRAGVLHDDDT